MRIVLSSCLMAVLALLAFPSWAETNEAKYSVRFDATWSASTHPTEFPAGAHFSSLVGAVHKPGVVLWKDGELASLGIQNMAERGITSTLASEVQGTGVDSLSVLLGGGSGSPGNATIAEFAATLEHSQVTLVTMVAPSPDWFVGVAGLSLLDDAGNWKPSVVVTLYPYDAGTDDGSTFTSPNLAASPHQPIQNLSGKRPFSTEPMGTFTFTRLNAPPAPLAFASAPAADQNPARAGQAVTFSAAVSGGGGQASIQWNFGDGTSAAGAGATHSFSAPGRYTVSATASEGSASVTASLELVVEAALVVGAGADSDLDGFSDAFENAMGFDAASALSQPFAVGAPAPVLAAPELRRFSIFQTRGRAARDVIEIVGTLPLSGETTLAGRTVYVTVGGLSERFTLSDSGASRTGSGRLKIGRAKKTGTSDLPFTLRLSEPAGTRIQYAPEQTFPFSLVVPGTTQNTILHADVLTALVRANRMEKQ